MKSLGISFCNTKVKITTNYDGFYKYLNLHFNKIIIPAAEDYKIEIQAEWTPTSVKILPADSKDMSQIGANTFMGDDSILTLRKFKKRKKIKFRIHLSKEKRKLYFYAYLQHKPLKDTLRYKLSGKPQELFFFELVYPLIYYPVFWYLEYFKNIHPLHAAGVRIKDKCILICGLEGVGKTTLSLALSKEPDSEIFSDNLLLFDEKYIYPCYEPIRIHKNEDRSLWEGRFQKINQFPTLKDFYEPLSYNANLQKCPNIAIISFFGNSFSVQEISYRKFINMALNFNYLTSELGEYIRYSSLFHLLDIDFLSKSLFNEVIEKLLANAKCYIIHIPKSAKLKENVNSLRSFIYKA